MSIRTRRRTGHRCAVTQRRPATSTRSSSRTSAGCRTRITVFSSGSWSKSGVAYVAIEDRSSWRRSFAYAKVEDAVRRALARFPELRIMVIPDG
jgi:hypothetical protein